MFPQFISVGDFQVCSFHSCIVFSPLRFNVSYFAYIFRLDEMLANGDKFFLNSPCQILFVYISAVPLKLEEKRGVTDHDQKVDDFLNGADLHRLFNRKLAKIQPFIFITKQFVSVK